MTDLFTGAMYGLLVMALIVAGWCVSWAFMEIVRETWRPFRSFRPSFRRVIDVLWIRREEGAEWPRGYGLVSKYYRGDGTARGTIVPFNLLVGWSLYVYWQTRFGWAPHPSWHDVQGAYADGRADAWKKAWDAGQEGGFTRGVEFQKVLDRD